MTLMPPVSFIPLCPFLEVSSRDKCQKGGFLLGFKRFPLSLFVPDRPMIGKTKLF